MAVCHMVCLSLPMLDPPRPSYCSQATWLSGLSYMYTWSVYVNFDMWMSISPIFAMGSIRPWLVFRANLEQKDNMACSMLANRVHHCSALNIYMGPGCFIKALSLCRWCQRIAAGLAPAKGLSTTNHGGVCLSHTVSGPRQCLLVSRATPVIVLWILKVLWMSTLQFCCLWNPVMISSVSLSRPAPTNTKGETSYGYQ